MGSSSRSLLAFLIGVSCRGAASSEPFPPSVGGSWQWVPIAGSRCMDGTETGVYIRYSSSGNKRLAIHLDGGGACFNFFTCHIAAQNAHPDAPASAGIFSNDTRNPLSDFNWIHVPYCTGDVHLGQASKEFEGSHRYFNGRVNLGLIMDRAVTTFPVVEHLYVTGESAGGFGAISNYDFLRGHWDAENGNANIRAVLVDDSGPILDDQAISVCLQETWRTQWNINASLPAGCPCIGNEGNIGSIWKFQMSKWPNDSFGLISSLNDGIISTFFGFGELDCYTPLPIGYTQLEAGLKRLSNGGVPVYMIPGNGHVHASSDEFYTRNVSDTLLYKWVGQLIADGPDPGSVVPSTGNLVVV